VPTACVGVAALGVEDAAAIVVTVFEVPVEFVAALLGEAETVAFAAVEVALACVLDAPSTWAAGAFAEVLVAVFAPAPPGAGVLARDTVVVVPGPLAVVFAADVAMVVVLAGTGVSWLVPPLPPDAGVVSAFGEGDVLAALVVDVAGAAAGLALALAGSGVALAASAVSLAGVLGALLGFAVGWVLAASPDVLASRGGAAFCRFGVCAAGALG